MTSTRRKAVLQNVRVILRCFIKTTSATILSVKTSQKYCYEYIWPASTSQKWKHVWHRYNILIFAAQKTMLTLQTKTMQILSLILGLCSVAYGKSHIILTKKGARLVSKLFTTSCKLFRLIHLTKIAYHPGTSGKVKKYSKTTVGRLQHYDAEQQNEWHTFVSPLTYAY